MTKNVISFCVITDPSQPQSALQVSDSFIFRFSLNDSNVNELQEDLRAADKDILFHFINTIVSFSYIAQS